MTTTGVTQPRASRASWRIPRWLDRAIPAFLAETQPALTPAVRGHIAPRTAGRP